MRVLALPFLHDQHPNYLVALQPGDISHVLTVYVCKIFTPVYQTGKFIGARYESDQWQLFRLKSYSNIHLTLDHSVPSLGSLT